MPDENRNKKSAVVLLSGGIDSSTTLAIAKAQGYMCYALSFDYGQRHKVELESAKKVAQALRVKKHLTITFDLREIGGSALTSDIEVPKQRSGARNQHFEERKNTSDRKNSRLKIQDPKSLIPVTYVPARNTIFLSFGLGWAEVLEVPHIFIGANVVDYSGYPDCRPEYLKAFEEMANLATKVSVEGTIQFKIHSPLLHLTKPEIIKKGSELNLDYSLTWSCYDPQESPFREGKGIAVSYVPCNRCDSCIIRARGFKEAGIPDPFVRRS